MLARGLVAAAALDLSVHLGQHLAEGIPDPTWFFALGIVGAIGLWLTAALWPCADAGPQNLVLLLLGLGLVWGGLAMHLADALTDGLTATHATGIIAGVLGVAMLALLAARLRRAL
ncbi:MAG: hypothetical protein ACR2OC_13485 [Solirubrobacterales bacterium]